MKDSLLINSKLSVNFWTKVIDISNYLYNWLSTRRNDIVFILEEVSTGTK